MTREEALMLVLYVGEKWGAAAAMPTDARLLDVRVQVWLDALADIDAPTLRAVLAQSAEQFPPNVAMIRSRCDDLAGTMPAIPSWDEFWPWVRSLAATSSMYHAERGVHRLVEVHCPWPALEGMITPSMLAGWAADGLTEHDFEMVIQAHVRRQFEARASRLKRDGTSDAPALAAWKDRMAGLPAIGHPGELDEPEVRRLS